ncbi:unnamed protein product [Auanema sp. JU1783]|nr:unnamed protein product [Auanema sp. JU1783]
MEQIPVNVDEKPMPRINSRGQEHLFLQNGLGLSFYHKSAEWDLLEATSSRYSELYQGCCGDDLYIDIRYKIVIRRKAIFFTVMLTIPCMLIANVTPFVFLIPPNEHKIGFSVSVFVAFTVFYLVLIELIPPTSLVIPLIGKYLFFTLLTVTLAILISVVNINVYRRQAFASEMSHWQRCIFVRILPKWLCLKGLQTDQTEVGSTLASTSSDLQSYRLATSSQIKPDSPLIPPQRLRLLSLVQMDVALKQKNKIDNLSLFRIISGQLNIIAANFHNQQMEGKITDEWRLMSLVVDRLFLVIYLISNAVMNVWFIMNSPTLFDNRPALGQEMPFKPLSGSSAFINYD